MSIDIYSESDQAPVCGSAEPTQAAAVKWWEPIEEIRSDADEVGPDTEMLLQKGLYHFHDHRPSEIGYRVVWRQDGTLLARLAQRSDLTAIDLLFQEARARGWQ